MSEDCHDIIISFWKKQHTFKPKTFQGREQEACEICGQLILASVHSSATAVPVKERTAEMEDANENPTS